MDERNLAAFNMDPSSPQRSFNVASPTDSVASGSVIGELSSLTVTDNHDVPNSPAEAEAPQRRKRGRPRKHPITPEKPKNGRSRTGCITCRKRKKKCDETRPECNNCKHMNKVCEGFYPPEHWKAGAERCGKLSVADHGDGQPPDIKTEARSKSLPKLIPGIETEADRQLLDHFNMSLSKSLCMWDGRRSPFDAIVQMALHDVGLMHAILCLSGFHLASGIVKTQIAENARPAAIDRRHHHQDRAVHLLRQKLRTMSAQTADDETLATIAMLIMRTVVAGDSRGEHRIHLKAGFEALALNQNSTPTEFRTFMVDLFAYHNISCSITSSWHRSPSIDDTFKLPSFVPPAAGSYLGVLDGLFVNISKINNLRGRIRERRARGLEPLVDFQTVHGAQTIDADLHEWPSGHHEDASRMLVSRLYRQCTWIYLYRTIYHQRPSADLLEGVETGVSLLGEVQDESTLQPVLLMPVFLLGCAAFEHRHRPQLDSALNMLEMNRGCGNIQHVRSVVHEIWRMMDRGDSDSWDWETLMNSMQLNFLIS